MEHILAWKIVKESLTESKRSSTKKRLQKLSDCKHTHVIQSSNCCCCSTCNRKNFFERLRRHQLYYLQALHTIYIFGLLAVIWSHLIEVKTKAHPSQDWLEYSQTAQPATCAGSALPEDGGPNKQVCKSLFMHFFLKYSFLVNFIFFFLYFA